MFSQENEGTQRSYLASVIKQKLMAVRHGSKRQCLSYYVMLPCVWQSFFKSFEEKLVKFVWINYECIHFAVLWYLNVLK